MPRADVIAWRLRPVVEADFEWVYALRRAALGDYVAQTWGWDDAAQRRRYAEAFGRKPGHVVCAARDDVGTLVVDEYPDELYLGLIALLPAWQNRGIGTDILRWLLRRAAGTDRALSLHVLRINTRATALYEREGLRVIATEETRLLMRARPRAAITPG